MQPDLVRIIESVYQFEKDDEAWIRGILESLAPWVGDGVGLFGFVYSVSSDWKIHPAAFAAVDCPQEALDVLPFAATRHVPNFVRSAYVDQDFAAASRIDGWNLSEGGAYAIAGGIADVWAIIGRNLGRRACGLFVNRRHEGAPSSGDESVFVRIASHLGAAHRLRERLHALEAAERAEAILTPGGRVQHAIGEATSRGALDGLQRAVLLRDSARASLRKRDPERALAAWKGLVSARWTLIDHFERNGRRYVLAQENEPDTRTCTELSSRERQVVANAAMGRSNKEIAYALGLADSTVRVLLTRAARKLGTNSRRELVERYESLEMRGRARAR
jgi:DNA-binding CsgD family transcriptional regulator